MKAFGHGCAPLRAHRSTASMPPPSHPEEEHHGQGGFIMAAHDPRCRVGAPLLTMLALVVPCSMAGCGGADGSKPAPVDTAQAKKAQEYMANYRDQMVAANKAKAQA